MTKSARTAVVLGLLSIPGSLHAFDVIPPELQGHWGSAEQCTALEQALVKAEPLLARHAPYSLSPNWLQRGDFFCAALAVDPITAGPLEGGWRAHVMCKEDAGERPWLVQITKRADALMLSWTSQDPEDVFAPPWEVGPLPLCTAPGS